jgi:hypothetical protein
MSSLHVQATVPLFTSRGWDLSELGSAPGTTVKLFTATAYLGLSQRAVVKLINTGEIAATRGRGNCWEVDITSLRAYKQKGHPRAS